MNVTLNIGSKISTLRKEKGCEVLKTHGNSNLNCPKNREDLTLLAGSQNRGRLPERLAFWYYPFILKLENKFVLKKNGRDNEHDKSNKMY